MSDLDVRPNAHEPVTPRLHGYEDSPMAGARRQEASAPGEPTQDRPVVDATGQARDHGGAGRPEEGLPAPRRRVIGRRVFVGRQARHRDSQTGAVREDKSRWRDGNPPARTAHDQLIILQDREGAFALVPLLIAPGACYLYPWRLALPYVVAGALIVCVALLLLDGPARVAHALVSTSAFVLAAAAMIITRQRTLQLARRNRRLAYTDPLTGIANMRSLRERISAELRGASRDARSFALFAMDMDNFKQVNDRFDHSMGDRVLIAVARAILERVRIDELVARRGGDEFAVVIDDADPRYADALMARIEEAIVRARTRICPDLRPTASVVSVPWRPGETPDDLLYEADVALHAKKARSRHGPRLVALANAG